MFPLRPLLEEQIRAIHKPRPTIIFPEGQDARIISAASALGGVANVVLVADRERVLQRIRAGEAQLHGSLRRFLGTVAFVQPDDVPDLCAEFHQAFYDLSHGKRWAVSWERAGELVRQPAIFSCMVVYCGYADAVLGGVAHSSRDFFRPALRLLHTDRTAFEVGLFSLPDSHPGNIYQQNLVAFADVAINVQPNARQLAEIAVGATKIVRDLVPPHVLPRVNGAILSYSTRGSAEGESVDRIREAGKLIPGMLADLAAQNPLYESIHIEAELQISCAISIAAASSKLHQALEDADSPLGRANVLVVSNLDSGNLLYHLYATRYPDADRVLMVGSMNARVLDFSRSASVQDVVLGGMASVLRLKRYGHWQRTPSDRFFPRYRVLVINPGSTSTKVAAYEGVRELFQREARHETEELRAHAAVYDQLEMRRQMVERMLAEEGISPDSLHAIVARGGLIRPVVSGTYAIDEAMLADLRRAERGEHASNLGAPIAHALATARGIPSYIVDPVVVDELDPVSRITGLVEYPRTAIWHALSQKAAARRFADEVMRDYEQLNLVVAHMGGGVTIGAHRAGRCFFVNDGLHEGPFTPERAGSVLTDGLLDLCFDRALSREDVQRRLVGQGGLVSLLGTSNLLEVEERMAVGDEHAALMFEALAQGIAGWIAAALPRFGGQAVDRIVLVGGMARSAPLVDRLRQLLAPLGVGLTVYPGSFEMEALRDGALRVLRGQEEVQRYT